MKLPQGYGGLSEVLLSNSCFAPTKLPGAEMANRLIKYFASKTHEDYDQVHVPFNVPVWPADDRNEHCGIGRVDLNALIPSPFRERDRIFQVGREDWSTALVAGPAVTTMHWDHVICGQIMPHFFGKKVRIRL
jgi:hypothetical protein